MENFHRSKIGHFNPQHLELRNHVMEIWYINLLVPFCLIQSLSQIGPHHEEDLSSSQQTTHDKIGMGT